MTSIPAAWTRELADRFGGGFDPASPALRTIGREAEFPVVNSQGWIGDVQLLLQEVAQQNPAMKAKYEGPLLVELKSPRFILAAEVGVGTVELITGPRDDLRSLESDHLQGLSCLLQAAEATEQRVLGTGIQPRSPASPEIMCPKPRYQVLLQTMGPSWLWFTLTASDQVHVDIGLDELGEATNCCSLLTAATVALCGNSSVFHDQNAKVCSSREHLMGQILSGDFRHGMPSGPIAGLEDLIGQLVGHRHLMAKNEGSPLPGQGYFSDYLRESGGPQVPGVFEAFLFHEHYVWNSARPRSAQGTLELRSACQQPAESHMCATALGLAMVEAHPELAQLLQQRLGSDPWSQARIWHDAVITKGLEAPEPSPGLLSEILQVCETALDRRGRGEARYLAPLRARLHARENPAQAASRLLDSDGMNSLLEEYHIRTAEVQR